jgi:hypothetical protein
VLGMIMFMFLTFRIQYWFVSKMYSLRHEGELTGNREIIIQAIMMSIVIMILNILLRVAVIVFLHSDPVPDEDAEILLFYKVRVFILHILLNDFHHKLMLYNLHCAWKCSGGVKSAIDH